MTGVDILEMQDDMSDEDYMEVFRRARAGRTLKELAEALNSRYTTATWSKVARGKIRLNAEMRNELRSFDNKPSVPHAAVPSGVTRMIRVGDGEPGVVAILPNRKLTLRFDGEKASIAYPATRVVGPRSHVCMRKDTFVAANKKRVEMGASWDEFILLAVSVLGEVGA